MKGGIGLKQNQWDSFRRVVFTDGMLLRADSLQAQQAYEDEKRRMISRNFFGWGVVYGLTAALDGERVALSGGLALDRDGREIYVPQDVWVSLDALFPGGRRPGSWRLCLEYAERPEGYTELWEPGESSPGSAPQFMLESFSLQARKTENEGDICVGVLRAEPQASGWNWGFTPVTTPFHAAGEEPRKLPEVAMGSLLFDLRERPGPGGVYYSREISHGLGPGEVFVTLAAKGWQDGRACMLTGDIELFGAQLRYGAKAFPERGTFQAALRCGEAISRHVRLEWRAERIGGQRLPEAPARKRFELEPQIVHLRPCQQARFFPVEGGAHWRGPCRFRVLEAHGGSITPEGWYSAPAREGVYRVQVSRRFPEDSATAYVVVGGDERL